MAEVSEVLERQGIAAFVKSWNDLIASVTAEIKVQGAEVNPAGGVWPVASEGASAGIPSAGPPL
jgi:hypothetical protein